MRYLYRYGKCFLIAFVIVLFCTILAEQQAAKDIDFFTGDGFLTGGAFKRAVGFIEYWLFWGISYTGPFIVTLILALLLTVATYIYEFTVALIRERSTW